MIVARGIAILLLAAVLAGCANPIATGAAAGGGVAFIQALIRGDSAAACALLPLEEQTPGNCQTLPTIASALSPCSGSVVQFAEQEAQSLQPQQTVVAVFAPSCGSAFVVSAYYLRVDPERARVCTVVLRRVNGELRPTLTFNFTCLP